MAAMTSLSFDIAALEVFLPLIAGIPTAYPTTLATRDGRQLRNEVASLGVTLVQATPSVWKIFLDSEKTPSFRKILCGGETLPEELAARLLDVSLEAWNVYGPTETTIWSTCGLIKQGGPISIGRPIGNTQVYVLDEEMEPVPVGVAGELYIGGDGLARGYIGQAGLTAQRFVANPFTQGKRLYRTGDRVRWRAGGELEFLGRMDEQVKIRGYRIEPAEVEAALLKHEQVKQALVMVREDEPGEKSLVGYVATGEGTSIEITQVREHLKQQLPAYLIPSAWVVLENLPLTENGKIDRNALPAPLKRAEASGYVAPRTPIEKAMAEIWMKILQVEQVGINDNFFDLGGHSLKAMRVITEVRDIFGVEMEPRTVFDAPTIVALCDWILNLLIDLANNQVR